MVRLMNLIRRGEYEGCCNIRALSAAWNEDRAHALTDSRGETDKNTICAVNASFAPESSQTLSNSRNATARGRQYQITPENRSFLFGLLTSTESIRAEPLSTTYNSSGERLIQFWEMSTRDGPLTSVLTDFSFDVNGPANQKRGRLFSSGKSLPLFSKRCRLKLTRNL